MIFRKVKAIKLHMAVENMVCKQSLCFSSTFASKITEKDHTDVLGVMLSASALIQSSIHTISLCFPAMFRPCRYLSSIAELKVCLRGIYAGLD